MIKKIFFFLFMYFTMAISVYSYTSYKQGDIVNYNGIDFYVLYDSLEDSSVISLLKKEPLTIDEVVTYGVGHINNYSMYSKNQVYDYNNSGYGRIVYYSSEQCGYVNFENILDDCKYDYETSEVKYVVDAWAKDKLNEKDLWKDNLGYSYRLITKEEILEYMNYKLNLEYDFSYAPVVGKTPSWFFSDNYFYFTMTNVNKINKYGDSYIGVYNVSDDGSLYIQKTSPYVTPGAIRPVVLLKKKAFDKNNNSKSNSNSSEYYEKNVVSNNNSSNRSNNNLIVSIPDTFTEESILSIAFGLVLIGTCITMYIYIVNRGKK